MWMQDCVQSQIMRKQFLIDVISFLPDFNNAIIFWHSQLFIKIEISLPKKENFKLKFFKIFVTQLNIIQFIHHYSIKSRVVLISMFAFLSLGYFFIQSSLFYT